MKFWKKTVSILLVHAFLLSSLPIGTLPPALAAPLDIPMAKEMSATPDNVVISKECGIVRSRFKGKSGKFIVHIQDAHCNYEAQSNIAKIIEGLIKNNALSFVSVEGADGIIDTSWFKSFPDNEVRKEVANYFMKKGEITGPEFLSITTNYPIKLYGAETREYYIQNLNAFTSSYPLKEATEKYFNQIKAVLNKLKALIYNDELRAMDSKAGEHEANTIQFNDYVRFLQAMAEKNKINVRQYENLFKLISVLAYEKKIDFNVTDKERSALIDELSRTVAKSALKELVNQSISFKVGKVSSDEYYGYIKDLAEKNYIDLSKKYPNLYNYIIYNSVYSKIDNEKLFQDIKALETAIKEKLFENDDQRTLEKFSRHIDTLIGLVNIKLLNDDFEYYKTHKEEFALEIFGNFIKDKSIQFGLAYEMSPPADTVASNIATLEDFYAIAIKRDTAMVDNTLEGMSKAEQKMAVLVTGGFHSEGMARLLEKQDISYMVVCPNITKDVPTPYIQVLTNRRTSFEEILVGAKDMAKGMLAPALISREISRISEEMKFKAPSMDSAAFKKIKDKLGLKMDEKISSAPSGIMDAELPSLEARVERVKSEWIRRYLTVYLGKGLKYADEQLHRLVNKQVMWDAYRMAMERSALSANPSLSKENVDKQVREIMSSDVFVTAFDDVYNKLSTPSVIGIMRDERFSGGEIVDPTKWKRMSGEEDIIVNIERPSIRARRGPDGMWDVFSGGIAGSEIGWDAVKNSPQLSIDDLGGFINHVYETYEQIKMGLIGAYSLTNVKRLNEESPNLYREANRELILKSKGHIRPLLVVENNEERKHDFPAFTNNILRLYFEFFQKELRKEGITRYEDFLMNKVASLGSTEWDAFYERLKAATVVIITDGGLKTRAGNETLGRLHSGLWTFVKGMDARTLNLIGDLTILKMMPPELRKEVLIWSASDNYTWLGKSNLPELLKDPTIASNFAVLTSGSRVQVIDTVSELPALNKVVLAISKEESNLEKAWEKIMASEELRKQLSEALSTADLANIRQRIRDENLREIGIYTAFPKGHERAYEMSGFWEKCKDDLKIIRIAQLNADKGALYKNPFNEILHKQFVANMMRELSKKKSKTLTGYNMDYTGLDALPVSYMTVAYQSRFYSMSEWEKMVPEVDISGEKRKIDIDDWRELKRIFDELFPLDKKGRTRLYCFDLGKDHIWQDTGHLTPVYQLFDYIAFDPNGRKSMQLPDTDQNCINTNLTREGENKNLIVKDENAKYLIENVSIIGGGNIEISGYSEFFVGDLYVDKLFITLKDNRLANKTVLEKLGLNADTVNTASGEALLGAFNYILGMRDFYSKIGVDQYKSLIPNDMQQLLTRALSSDITLTDQDYLRLNRALLEAIYPQEIRKRGSRIVMSNVAIYVPRGKTWIIPPNTQILDAAFRWDRVMFSKGARDRGHIRISNFFPEMNTPTITVRSDENINTIRMGIAGGGYNVMISRSPIFLPFKYDKGIKGMINDYLSDISKWETFLEFYPNTEKVLSWYIKNTKGISDDVKNRGVEKLPLSFSTLSETMKDNIGEMIYNTIRDEHSDILFGPGLAWNNVKNVSGGFFSLRNPSLGNFTFSQAQQMINYTLTDGRRRKNLTDLEAARRGDYSSMDAYFGSWAPQSELIATGVVSSAAHSVLEARIKTRAEEISRERPTGSDPGNWDLAEEELAREDLDKGVGAIREKGGGVSEIDHRVGELSVNAMIKKIIEGQQIEDHQAYALLRGSETDKQEDIRDGMPTKMNEFQKENFKNLLVSIRDRDMKFNFIILQGFRSALPEKVADLVFHPGRTRHAVYLDEVDLLYLLSLSNGVDLILKAVAHEVAHIGKPGASEAEIEGDAPTKEVRDALALRNRQKSQEAIRVEKPMDKYEITQDLDKLKGTIDRIGIGTRDMPKIGVIVFNDTSIVPTQVAKAAEDAINRRNKKSLIEVRTTDKKLALEGIRKAAEEMTKAGIEKIVIVSIAGDIILNQFTKDERGELGTILNIKTVVDNYTSIIGLYDLALRVAYDLGDESIRECLNRIAVSPEGGFTVGDVRKFLGNGYFSILPKIKPADMAELVAAYRAAQAALISL